MNGLRLPRPPQVFKMCETYGIMRKINLRWCLTPVRLSYTSTSSSCSCWRQCGNEGSLLHICWSWPIISHFWVIVTDIIIEVTKLLLVLTPELAILDLTLPNIPHCLRTVIHHILLAARVCIAKHWKTSTTPTLTELARRLNLSCHSEVTFTPFKLFPSKRRDLWSSWIQSKYYVWLLFWALISGQTVYIIYVTFGMLSTLLPYIHFV